MKIIHLTAECYPVAKVGGLGDVVDSLAKTQQQKGEDVQVVLPYYSTPFTSENEFVILYHGQVQLGQFNFPFTVCKERDNSLGFELILISIPDLFDRDAIYGYEDDIERFMSFQKAFLQWINSLDTQPDIIHCHDHHTALVPFMMYNGIEFNKIRDLPTVLTIHNALYQGQFGFDKLHYFPTYDLSKTNLLEWGGRINSIAVGLRSARVITTVSPTYLNEINEHGYGLEHLFREVRYKSKGILNGIDDVLWNPATDPVIAATYNYENFDIGKSINKEKLCEMYNFDVNKPLISFIGRLFEEKGADLLCDFIKKIQQENADKFNILILGTGNKAIEQELMALLIDYQRFYKCFIGFNENLAHQIYAGSDFLLMPSRTESCGLNQMYAYRYGSIPIVRRTGGLKDTVTDSMENGLGICFEKAEVEDIEVAIERAILLFENKIQLHTIRKAGMQLDHSWNKAYQEYLKIYNLITK
ncbi:glycogen synthase [Flavobacterium faecale]|uniref:Glycogen synthase n=1 Tax=Flavobacterium faecale TaxID=1355330 RepID=A0A2S1LFS6_9FLAO|nr:glycogen synthase [Flavobacterium faecale]AWG22559.1 glycogen synthase [Flavobacterium faecale]